MKEKNITNGPTTNMIEMPGKEVDLKVSSPDGVSESKTKPWALPPEMLKPNGPSPLDYKIVPENKQNS